MFRLPARNFFDRPVSVVSASEEKLNDVCSKWKEIVLFCCTGADTEVGIYKRKQESKKTRKHAFDQESDQEK